MTVISLQIKPKMAQNYLHELSEYFSPVLRTKIFLTSPLPQLSGLQIVGLSLKVQLQINPMPVNKYLQKLEDFQIQIKTSPTLRFFAAVPGLEQSGN